MNVCEHLSSTADLFPDREAIRFEGRTFTYAVLELASRAAAEILSRRGLRRGDRLALMLPNGPAFPIWYYAALRLGSIAVSISTRASAAEVRYLLDDCGARFFVGEEDSAAALEPEMPASVEFAAWSSITGDRCNGDPLPDPAADTGWIDMEPQDPALILYTSGTTGFSKGVTLSHANVRSNVHAFEHLCRMQPGERLLLAVPLFHCFGQNALLNSGFHAGATLIMQRKFDPVESKQLIREERVTQLYGVPMMFQLLLDRCEPSDLASVRYCFSAAATLPVQVGQRWREKFRLPIHEGYGLTETSPFASYNHRLKQIEGSIGMPVDGVEMKIVDPATGRPCPVNEPGEIVIRGPNVMLGYWNRDEETRAIMRDGWLHSGDIGTVDELGYFRIVDRLKDMISVGGLKVFPAEVERVLLEHPQVAEAAVIGIPDEVFGEQVIAFVVPNTSPGDDRLADIRRHAAGRLASFKVPRLILPIEELPRNPSGKVLKRRLREVDIRQQLAAAVHSPLSAGQAAASPELADQLRVASPAERRRTATDFIRHLVRELSDSETLPEPDDRFLDCGLDSLLIVELSNRLQAELGSAYSLPATLVFDHPRICDLSEYLVSLVSKESPSLPADSEPAQAKAAADPTLSLLSEIEPMSEEEALAELLKELGD